MAIPVLPAPTTPAPRVPAPRWAAAALAAPRRAPCCWSPSAARAPRPPRPPGDDRMPPLRAPWLRRPGSGAPSTPPCATGAPPSACTPSTPPRAPGARSRCPPARALAHPLTHHQAPAASPDGRWLACVAQAPDRLPEVWLLATDGSGARRVTDADRRVAAVPGLHRLEVPRPSAGGRRTAWSWRASSSTRPPTARTAHRRGRCPRWWTCTAAPTRWPPSGAWATSLSSSPDCTGWPSTATCASPPTSAPRATPAGRRCGACWRRGTRWPPTRATSWPPPSTWWRPGWPTRRAWACGASATGAFLVNWLVTQTGRFACGQPRGGRRPRGLPLPQQRDRGALRRGAGGRPRALPPGLGPGPRRGAHAPAAHGGRRRRSADRPGQGAAFRDALRAAGVEVAYHVYPGEDHALAQSVHRVDYLRRLLAWFDRHLRNGADGRVTG